jgi:hypothetical protein
MTAKLSQDELIVTIVTSVTEQGFGVKQSER